MILRKINAWFGLITTLLLLDHAIFHAVWMLSKGSIEKSANIMPVILYGSMVIHAIISIILVVFEKKGDESKKIYGYPKLNKTTYIQRASGILLMLFTALHVLGAMGITKPPLIVHAILPPLFFTLALMHTAISTVKAFITLGIGNAKFIKISDIVIKVICGITLIADVVGFYLFVV